MNAIMCAVEDLTGLDRFDRRLNTQRGPRRLLLLWLDAYPVAFVLCYALWACWSFNGDFRPAVVAAAVVALLMAIPVVLVLSGLHALRVWEMRKRPAKAWPRLSWRGFAFQCWFAVSMAVYFAVFADDANGKPHPGLLTAQWFQVVICVGFLGLFFVEDYYAKRVGKRRMAAQAQLLDGGFPGS
jgi:hypothetical protein